MFANYLKSRCWRCQTFSPNLRSEHTNKPSLLPARHPNLHLHAQSVYKSTTCTYNCCNGYFTLKHGTVVTWINPYEYIEASLVLWFLCIDIIDDIMHVSLVSCSSINQLHKKQERYICSFIPFGFCSYCPHAIAVSHSNYLLLDYRHMWPLSFTT
jgi:hypothetical protein